ncbi:hypothetical protein ACGFYZ_28845 [Streptomyces sp. NPDC048330]|uniref:hypothetical protein n=1 Tax=Streptomyces sp. NPDC048330 TaxID=3365533 RepID=UPI00371B2F51
MTGWIERGVIAWVDENRREDESVLVYFRGVSLSDMVERLRARHRPPFAYGVEPGAAEWGVVVHHLHNPLLGDFDGLDYRELCSAGGELMVFVPNPCVAKAHGPHAFHFKDGQAVTSFFYEDPDVTGDRWPAEIAERVRVAGLDGETSDYEALLTRAIGDHLGLPALDRGALTVDRGLIASYF